MVESLQNHGINKPPIHWWRPVLYAARHWVLCLPDLIGDSLVHCFIGLVQALLHGFKMDGRWGFHSQPKLDGLLENPKITWMWGYSPFQETSIWFWRNHFHRKVWGILDNHKSPIWTLRPWPEMIPPTDLSPWFHKWVCSGSIEPTILVCWSVWK
jgi:hypothetical protein